MITKLFQLRDRMTNIPVMATRLDPGNAGDHSILSRAGYGSSVGEQGAYIVLTKIAGGEMASHYDPYHWRGNRTMTEAHKHLLGGRFDELPSGSVIDVQFLLGETTAPKEFE